MPPAAVTQERPRNRAGCIIGCLSGIVLLLVIVGASWLFLVRPYVHNVAESQLDQAMDNMVQQIPPPIVALPAGPFQIQENTLNNLVVLNIAPSSPIKNPQTHITTSGIRMDFQLYGFPCALTAVPKAENGQLKMTNVGVEGIVGLIMSPDEITTLMNKHLSDAMARVKHPIQDVKLENQVVTLQLGAPSLLP